MKVLVDENIPHTTVDYLRELGHDVKDIRGTADQGLADSNLWALAMSEGRLLITTDKGFTEFRGVAGAPRYSRRAFAPAQPSEDPLLGDARDGSLSGRRLALLTRGNARCDHEHVAGG